MIITTRSSGWRTRFLTVPFQLFMLGMLALALRLLVWQWRAAYPPGGDEREYWQQALTLLQHKQYAELQLMRPPLYTVFLAGSIVLFDSVMQNVRLVQVLISALTVVPIYGLTWALFRSRWAAFVAGLLVALNYTLAATATELLTETVFLFGLNVLFWLLVLVQNTGVRSQETEDRRQNSKLKTSLVWAALAGLVLGMLALTRSVALPLLPLGALWLWLQEPGGQADKKTGRQEDRKTGRRAEQQPALSRGGILRRFVLPGVFVAAALVLILPWTARNAVVYGAPILIDTAGAENLWLDNNFAAATPADPLGREAAKRALYALRDDRPARQRLATERGLAEIAAHPGWFAAKVWGEAKKFFALQYFDELREKRAIWLPPIEVWCKLLLGDGLWLAILLAGVVGLANASSKFKVQSSKLETHNSQLTTHNSQLTDPRWLLVPWALYIFATSLLFHVELRYRLPLYPVLVPYAAWAIASLTRPVNERRVLGTASSRRMAAITLATIITVTLLHRFYPAATWLLANKHVALWQAERALAVNAAPQAQVAAQRALSLDDESALARVALARAALLAHDRAGAAAALDAAIAALAAHPHAHLLRGALLRQDGKADAARAEFAYETGSLEDLQAWAWSAFAPLGPPPVDVRIGDGLDLGAIHGFYPAEHGYRWTQSQAQIQISIPTNATMLELEIAPGRTAGLLAPTLIVSNDRTELGRVQLVDGWQTVRMPLATREKVATITLDSHTFRPRDTDRASDDTRVLGVMVRRIAAVGP